MNVTKHTKYIWQIDNFLPDDEIDYFSMLWDSIILQ